jgi:hypothetical protein
VVQHDDPGVWIVGDPVIREASGINPSVGDRIEGNSIYGNAGLGIELGDTPVAANGNPDDPNGIAYINRPEHPL